MVTRLSRDDARPQVPDDGGGAPGGGGEDGLLRAFLAAKSDGARDLLTQLHAEIWERRRETARLSVPALCYTLQNNLIFLALSNPSAASCQVLYQTKTITTALFSVVLLGKRFGWRQWLFFLLAFGVVLVQSQDAKSEQAPEGNRLLVGIGAALTAAALSGFAGCYLELMFNKGATSLWMRNVQLALFTIPLQLVAVAQSDLAAVRRHGLLQGFTTLTWLVVFTQFAGGLVVAVVIKYCGNILKTMATVVAIIVTCFLSMASTRGPPPSSGEASPSSPSRYGSTRRNLRRRSP